LLSDKITKVIDLDLLKCYNEEVKNKKEEDQED
jgi:hypothetical protein